MLKYISISELQKILTATDNKCKSYKGFSQQLMFANFGVIQSNNPVEQEKRIKYTDLIANAVMLQNLMDLQK